MLISLHLGIYPVRDCRIYARKKLLLNHLSRGTISPLCFWVGSCWPHSLKSQERFAWRKKGQQRSLWGKRVEGKRSPGPSGHVNNTFMNILEPSLTHVQTFLVSTYLHVELFRGIAYVYVQLWRPRQAIV